MKFLYALKEGETFTIFKGLLIIAHPDRLPKIIHSDGTEEEFKLDADNRHIYFQAR